MKIIIKATTNLKEILKHNGLGEARSYIVDDGKKDYLAVIEIKLDEEKILESIKKINIDIKTSNAFYEFIRPMEEENIRLKTEIQNIKKQHLKN